MRTVLLCRHGETDWNAERRLQGWAPVGLSERGREQAAALGAEIAAAHDVDEVVASDLERTRETAEHVAEATGASLRFDRGWRERGFGVYQGLPYADVAERHPEFDLRTNSIVGLPATPEGGESVEDVHERVLDAWERLHADVGGAAGSDAGDGEDGASDDSAGDDTVAVVTHGGPLHLVLGRVKGLSVEDSLREGRQGNCSINEVRVNGDGEFALRRENGCEHLE